MSDRPVLFVVDDPRESPSITDTLDSWYLDMRKNFMVKVLEVTKPDALHDNRETEYSRLHDDVKTMRQMLIQYEHIIDQKDQTEENLNKALNLLYDKTIAHRYYYRWRLAFIEQRRQAYAVALSQRFYAEKLKRKFFSNWRHLTNRDWKARFEWACEQKSQAILEELSRTYELKHRNVELRIRRAKEEIIRLRTDKRGHDENVREAFLRGVCALNMEAMGALYEERHLR